jgi:hypothetical protein
MIWRAECSSEGQPNLFNAVYSLSEGVKPTSAFGQCYAILLTKEKMK